MLRPGRLLLLALTPVLLNGCIFFDMSNDRSLKHQPTYKDGYDDGCATSNNQGANMRRGDLVRDEALYAADKAYRVGWANGHAACERMAPTSQSEGVLPDVHPGGGH